MKDAQVWVFCDVLVRVTVAVMKHHEQKQLGKGRVYLAYASTSLFIIGGSQDRYSSRVGTRRHQRPSVETQACNLSIKEIGEVPRV